MLLHGGRYTNIYVGRPSLEEDYIQASGVTSRRPCLAVWMVLCCVASLLPQLPLTTGRQAGRCLCVCGALNWGPLSAIALQTELTPNQCRLRDQTYSAPITVDVEYTRWVLLLLLRFIQRDAFDIDGRGQKVAPANPSPPSRALGCCS